MTTTGIRKLNTGMGSFERQQELMVRDMDGLREALRGRGRHVGELGDLLVYLKYHAAICFELEREAMLEQGYPSYRSHRDQHQTLLGEISRLLERIASETASYESIKEATERCLNSMKGHVAEQDGDLLRYLSQSHAQAEPVRHRPARAMDYGYGLGLAYHTA